MALSTQQAKQLRLTDVLARLGCEPVRRKRMSGIAARFARKRTLPSKSMSRKTFGMISAKARAVIFSISP